MATTIRHTVALGNLWGDSDLSCIDTDASERVYVERLAAALAEAYPDADIEVRAERVSGVTQTLVVLDDDEIDRRVAAGEYDPEDQERARVDEIAGRVWQAWLESGLVEAADAASR